MQREDPPAEGERGYSSWVEGRFRRNLSAEKYGGARFCTQQPLIHAGWTTEPPNEGGGGNRGGSRHVLGMLDLARPLGRGGAAGGAG